jgi:hypothetical protein
MKKILVILVLVVLIVGLIGCTGETPPAGDDVTVNTLAEADDVIGDIGTDLSGISDSLDDIDSTLTDG